MNAAQKKHANLIGGAWVPTSDYRENYNPSDLDDVIGLYGLGGAGDADAAVGAAAAAVPVWAGLSIQERADLLDRVGTEILAKRAALGRLLAREEGKTTTEATAEATRAGYLFKYYAGEVLRQSGERIDSLRSGIDVEVLREPLGVVGVITPWNFPIAIPAWKIAPALAYGNCVVLKPADLTPGSAHALAEIIEGAGFPPGVFNLVMGSGRVVGEALIENRKVAGVSFTGSVEVGRTVVSHCAQTGKKVQAEMGGKNPIVILDDADLDAAIPACTNAAFGSTGQRCTAASRFIVQKTIIGPFTERLLQATRAVRVGHALAPETQVGPVVSEAQLAGNLRYIELARTEGATVVGGETIELGTRGYFQRPAVFLGATNEMRSSREEIFGPCVSVIEADDFEHALEVANDTPFGLSAAVFTRSLRHAREFRRRSAVGMVMVNLPTAGVDYHVPFGGRRSSSFGPREQGRYAREFYTSVKTAYTYAG